MTDFLVVNLELLYYLPEDTIISQGEFGESLYVIGKGEVDVFVKDFKNVETLVRCLP